MATLALKPAFPFRTTSPGSKHDRRKPHGRASSRSTLWRTTAIVAGAMGVAFFSVLTPMIGDPAARLFAMDTTYAIGADAWFRDRIIHTFEFTPITLGPAISDEMLAFLDEDSEFLTMPELEVHARPLIDIDDLTPPG